MAITLNTKPILDLPRWKPVATQPSAAFGVSGGPAGTSFACDRRSRGYANPEF